MSEKSGSSSGGNGFRGPLEGRFGADDPLGERIVLGWTQMGVYFQLPEGQKVNSRYMLSGVGGTRLVIWDFLGGQTQ